MVVVSRFEPRPLAACPITFAVAGKTTNISLQRASSMWPGLFSTVGSCSRKTSSQTRATVEGGSIRAAERVMITLTSFASSARRVARWEGRFRTATDPDTPTNIRYIRSPSLVYPDTSGFSDQLLIILSQALGLANARPLKSYPARELRLGKPGGFGEE